jgi:hypothetical protein
MRHELVMAIESGGNDNIGDSKCDSPLLARRARIGSGCILMSGVNLPHFTPFSPGIHSGILQEALKSLRPKKRPLNQGRERYPAAGYPFPRAVD